MLDHSWETTGRLRVCTVCGARQYLSCATKLHGVTHSWLPADVPDCSGRKARSGRAPTVRPRGPRPPPPGSLAARVLAAIREQPDGAPSIAKRIGHPPRDVSACLKQQRDLGRIVGIGEMPRADGKPGRGAIIYRVMK